MEQNVLILKSHEAHVCFILHLTRLYQLCCMGCAAPRYVTIMNDELEGRRRNRPWSISKYYCLVVCLNELMRTTNKCLYVVSRPGM